MWPPSVTEREGGWGRGGGRERERKREREREREREERERESYSRTLLPVLRPPICRKILLV